jgi:hypothetical protein
MVQEQYNCHTSGTSLNSRRHFGSSNFTNREGWMRVHQMSLAQPPINLVTATSRQHNKKQKFSSAKITWNPNWITDCIMKNWSKL